MLRAIIISSRRGAAITVPPDPRPTARFSTKSSEIAPSTDAWHWTGVPCPDGTPRLAGVLSAGEASCTGIDQYVRLSAVTDWPVLDRILNR